MTTLFRTARWQPTRLSRACALLLTGTVLLLAILAASPAAHHWLHADADHDDHECAITLYAQGIAPAGIVFVLAIVVWRLLGLAQRAGTEWFVSPPRYLHLPGRAPPLD